jgi:glucosamine-6-phosphate deaminase
LGGLGEIVKRFVERFPVSLQSRCLYVFLGDSRFRASATFNDEPAAGETASPGSEIFLCGVQRRVYNATMSNPAGSLRRFHSGEAEVEIYRSSVESGAAAAEKAARIIRAAIASHGRARVIGATGNSQIPFIEALVQEDVQWTAVELFHMDEYVGMRPDHPSSFRYWIRTRLEERVHPSKTHYLKGDAPDLKAEIRRYSELLNAAPIDVAFVGFGENGHIAFNDPPVADFHDPETLKMIALDDACRRQQAGEGHFADVASVPLHALTITCTGLLRAEAWVCHVPDSRKAEAVKNALEGPVSESCPASLVQRHANSYVFLDSESASLLLPEAVTSQA